MDPKRVDELAKLNIDAAKKAPRPFDVPPLPENLGLPKTPGGSTMHANGGVVQSRTDHVNKSYKMAAGGVVPPAGTIGAFPSGIMPQGAPVDTPEPVEQGQPQLMDRSNAPTSILRGQGSNR